MVLAGVALAGCVKDKLPDASPVYARFSFELTVRVAEPSWDIAPYDSTLITRGGDAVFVTMDGRSVFLLAQEDLAIFDAFRMSTPLPNPILTPWFAEGLGNPPLPVFQDLGGRSQWSFETSEGTWHVQQDGHPSVGHVSGRMGNWTYAATLGNLAEGDLREFSIWRDGDLFLGIKQVGRSEARSIPILLLAQSRVLGYLEAQGRGGNPPTTINATGQLAANEFAYIGNHIVCTSQPGTSSLRFVGPSVQFLQENVPVVTQECSSGLRQETFLTMLRPVCAITPTDRLGLRFDPGLLAVHEAKARSAWMAFHVEEFRLDEQGHILAVSANWSPCS
jgi:hypothetical protein